MLMRSTKSSLVSLFAGVLLAWGASAAYAADSKKVTGPAPAGTAYGKGVAAPEAYGIAAVTRISLLSYAFQGNTPYLDQISDDGNSYRTMTAGSFGFSASVSIPAGAAITAIGFDNCDNAVSGEMDLTMFDRSGDHLFTPVGTVNSTDSSGCGFNSTALGAPYNVDSNIDHVFEIYIYQTAVDPTLKFRSAYVEYQRRVSPAPVSATFNDVAPGDFGFQYIEALAASGITGGCGGGAYCPNGTLTRAQMAIFIAKALGLHWPN
jgi:hypothetical protein